MTETSDATHSDANPPPTPGPTPAPGSMSAASAPTAAASLPPGPTAAPPHAATEHAASPEAREPGTTADPVASERAAPPPRRRSALGGALAVLCFLILAGALAYLWQQVRQQEAAQQNELQAIEQHLESLDKRADQAAPGDQAAVNALSGRVAALEKRQIPDLGPLDARLSKLESQISALDARIAALEKRPAGSADLDSRVSSLTQQVQALSGRDQQASTELQQRLTDTQSRLASLEQNAGQINKVVERTNRIARLQGAIAALEAGQPVGEIPGAPPAIARFNAVAPPTDAALRRAYYEAEQKALAAGSPDTEGKPFFARVLAHTEDLVTVRRGDRVLVGDPAAGVLARARSALEANDLAGAVAAVSELKGPPAEAMANWLEQAKALLAARAALADMAAHT